jgi:hypothetical protein
MKLGNRFVGILFLFLKFDYCVLRIVRFWIYRCGYLLFFLNFVGFDFRVKMNLNHFWMLSFQSINTYITLDLGYDVLALSFSVLSMFQLWDGIVAR